MTKRPSIRARIDWAAPRAYYVAMDKPRTFAAVARRYGVSEAAVRKHARDEAWAELAMRADEQAAEKALAAAVKTREQRALQDARIRDRAAQLVEDKLAEETSPPSDEWVRLVLADADKRVRLNEGEATDHYAVAVVQAGFREHAAANDALLVELVERGLKGKALVAAYRSEIGPRVQERLALLDAPGTQP